MAARPLVAARGCGEAAKRAVRRAARRERMARCWAVAMAAEKAPQRVEAVAGQ
jgi:hypothetical protein